MASIREFVRKNPARVAAFVPPKPDEGEWVLNEATCDWQLAPQPE